ncbi:Aminotransferase [Nitrosopumilaceae archaeon]|nr:aminotransferase class I/II-fold pyridoxal phosphate-dependent enzyme [Nitrosopumilus sp.]MDA7974518.1 aminotransferase class I/II-fold pyridoxal phosphate-dependent enzyme [Nitrosopumilus sp.]CAI9832058.1 Aminotransferase [Nitrosopumilaceae archaeon]
MSMDGLRDRMDEITLSMTRLLKERTDIAREIGRLKSGAGIPVSDESREDDLRQKVAALCGEIGLDRSAAARHLNFLLNESVGVQSEGRQTHLSIFRRAKEREAAGKRIIHMEVGELDLGPPEEASTALAGACDAGYARYGGPAGRMELRRAIADALPGRDPEGIMVCPGARFAVYAAVTSLLDPGDEVITIEPAWPAYRDCAAHAGAKVRAVQTDVKDGWIPDPGKIEEAAGPDTRMIILNYPNNPTGAELPQDVMDGIMGIAKKGDMYVLSDEVYAAYSRNHRGIPPGYKKGITVQSLSKSHAMTGFRIGYAAADPAIIRKMSQVAALCITSVPEPIQYAAIAALGADTSGMAGAVRSRLGVLEAEASRIGLEFAPAPGSMYLFARTGMDGTRLAEEALAEGLAVAPGEGFGPYPDYVRLSACRDEKTLMDGMNILGRLVGRA